MREHEQGKENDLFSTIKGNTVSGDIVKVLVHNVRWVPRHVDDILRDNRIINSDIVGFTETHIKPSDSTFKTIETLNSFNINFNDNKNKFFSLAYGSRNDATVLNKFDATGAPIVGFRKHAFADRVFTLMIVYRKQSMHMQEFFSNVAKFNSNTFYRYYSKGTQL